VSTFEDRARRGLATAFLLLAISPPLLSAGSCRAQLLAGAAKSEITPDLAGHKVYLAGFGHDRVATAVHDPLYTRCLALQSGKSLAVFCAADLIGLFYADVEKIREYFRAQAPAGAHLVVASTHVHEGPDTIGLWGPTAVETGVDPKYMEEVEKRIAATAIESSRAMKPARLRLARDDHPLLGQLQSVDRPPYVKDPRLLVMQVVATAGGNTIATVVNWSDHPETLNRKNTAITADYPGWICGALEQRFGGVAVFFNGAVGKVSTLGSQVALLDPQTARVAEDGGWRKPELLGLTIGDLAERSLLQADVASPDALLFHSSMFFVPLGNDRFRMAEAAGIFADRRPLYTRGQPDPSMAERDDGGHKIRYAAGRDLLTEIDYIELKSGNRLLAELVTIPGEAFPEVVNGGVERYPGADYPDAPIETPVAKILRSRYQFIIGLGNDEIGYIIPKAEWDEQAPWLNNSPQAYYGEINSAGPDAAAAITRALADLVQQASRPSPK
jgi:hypothetical protein